MPSGKLRGGGFSLVELIVVMLVLAILSGGIAVSSMKEDDCDRIVAREAEDLALWLSDRMSRAQAEECPFRLYVLGHGGSAVNADLTIIWLGGTLVNKSETYRSSRVNIWPESQVNQFVYDGAWQSLTPALTVSVKPISPLSEAKRLYVIVSGTGYTRISTKAQ